MNSKIKLVRKLKDKKERDRTSLFIVEGIRQVEEALINKARFEFVLYLKDADNELLPKIKELNIENHEIDEKTLRPISDTETPQGIIAVINKQSFTIKDAAKGNDTLIIICDGIQDPGNLGAIIRSSAGAGATGVVLSDDCVDVYNPKTIRSTSGAIFKIPVIAEADLKNVILSLKKDGVKILGADPVSTKSIYDTKIKTPLAFVIGNEGSGIKKDVLDLCDEKVMIPMKRGVESLNAAVSASIILFEAVRQRG